MRQFKMHAGLLQFAFLLAVFATHQCFSQQEDYDFTASNRAFAAAVYKELAKTEPANFLTCPLSVQTVMALTSLGAKGETSMQISRGLNLPADTRALKNIFKQLMPQLRGNEFYSLTSANKLFVHNSFKLNRNYIEDAMNIFDADVDNVDFKDNYVAADNINQWVQKKTNNKIQELVAPDDISADTKLILANALHFKGKWKIPFDPIDTIKRPFYTSTHEAHNVDMMQLTDFFNYYENKELDAKFLELPYQGNDVSMVFVLPNKINGLEMLENRMEEVLQEQPYTKQHVRIQIPKFSMETSIKYKPILQQLGIEKVFTPAADLSQISSTGNLLINNVLQKTFINVTETGTEAAAATAGSVISLSLFTPDRLPKLHFVADHSFFFYLNHADIHGAFKRSNKKQRLPLFVGRIETAKTFEI